MSLLGPYLAASALLVVAGAAKAWRPGDTARAIGQVLSDRAIPGAAAPGTTILTTATAAPAAVAAAVRVLAMAEALLGVAAIAWPTPATAAAVAASYLAFAAFVLLARARGGPLATCGCFGTPDTPPTALHAVVDIGFAAASTSVAAGAAGHPLHPVNWLLARQTADGLPLAAESALLAAVALLTMSALPRLQAIRATLDRPSANRPAAG